MRLGPAMKSSKRLELPRLPLLCLIVAVNFDVISTWEEREREREKILFILITISNLERKKWQFNWKFIVLAKKTYSPLTIAINFWWTFLDLSPQTQQRPQSMHHHVPFESHMNRLKKLKQQRNSIHKKEKKTTTNWKKKKRKNMCAESARKEYVQKCIHFK